MLCPRPLPWGPLFSCRRSILITFFHSWFLSISPIPAPRASLSPALSCLYSSYYISLYLSSLSCFFSLLLLCLHISISSSILFPFLLLSLHLSVVPLLSFHLSATSTSTSSSYCFPFSLSLSLHFFRSKARYALSAARCVYNLPRLAAAGIPIFCNGH